MGEVMANGNPELNLPSKFREKLTSFKRKASANLFFEYFRKQRISREVAKRNFSEQDNFTAFLHEEEGETFISPFTVFVYGTHGEILGKGTVIGKLYDKETDTQEPVVSIPDAKSPTGEVQLLNQECAWRQIGDAELDATMQELGPAITTASFYVTGETKSPFMPKQQ